MPAHHLNAGHVAAVVAGWRQRYARNTQATRTKALRRILRELGPLIDAPHLWKAVPRIGEVPPSKQVIPEEQKRLLMAACPQWLRLFILLCSDCALRFAEAARCSRSGWNREQATITVKTKGGYQHTLPVSDEITAILQTIDDTVPADQPFIQTLHGKPLKPQGIRAAFNRARRKAGLGPTVHPHAFRSTTATALYALTKDLRAVKQLLGHRTLHATARYICDLDPAKLLSLLRELKPMTELKQ